MEQSNLIKKNDLLRVANKRKHELLLTFTVCFQFSIFPLLSSTCCLHAEATSAASHLLLVSNKRPILVLVCNEDRFASQVHRRQRWTKLWQWNLQDVPAGSASASEANTAVSAAFS